MIILVRHGQTLFNAQGRLQGRLDSPLSEEGFGHARSLGELIAMLARPAGDWQVVTSPLGRAVATAAIIAELCGMEGFVPDERLTEVSFGEWDGKTYEEIEAGWSGLWQSSLRLSWAAGCPGAETYDEAIARTSGWLEEFRSRNVVAVTHGVTGSLMRGQYAGLGADEMLRLPVPHDAAFVLDGGRLETIDCS